ncbi:MAG: hypothetical protein ABL921_34210, partial [Pirellula sp.]
MKHFNWYRLFSAGISLAVVVACANSSLGQCACNNANMVSEGVVYGSVSAGDVLGPDALLEESDDPAKIVNLTVVVHEKAIVSVNGEPTVTMGTVRPYIVRGLKPGKTYKFEIQGLVRQPKGDVYVAKETITLKAGESKQVVLNVRRANRSEYPPPPPPPPAPMA